MSKFRKKPITIDAVQWFKHGDHPAVRRGLSAFSNTGVIDTLEGNNHIVNPGDWIITGVKGEVYPCRDDIFRMTYEPLPRDTAHFDEHKDAPDKA